VSVVVTSRSHALAHAGATDVPAGVGRGRQRPPQGHLPPTAPRLGWRDTESVGPGSPSDPSGGTLPGPLDPQADACCGATSPGARAPLFEHAILAHLDAAYNLARWLAHDPVDAEAIVQDACVTALPYFASMRGDNGRTLLLRIVRNTAYARLRTGQSGVEPPWGDACNENDDGGVGADVVDPDPGKDRALATAQEPIRLETAMAALPIDLRECLVLHEMEAFSYKDIARITEVSIGTVMTRLYRARHLLMAASIANCVGQATVPSR
jgi:RNA polymerase sigma-70 factor (ECF subfamily)